MSDDDEADDVEEPLVTRTEARQNITTAIRFFEQNPSIGSEHLAAMWKAMRTLDTVGVGKQKTNAELL